MVMRCFAVSKFLQGSESDLWPAPRRCLDSRLCLRGKDGICIGCGFLEEDWSEGVCFAAKEGSCRPDGPF